MAKKNELDALKDLRKLLGDDAVFFGGEELSGTHEHITTGSPSVDYATGIGGVARGRVTQVAGVPSSGKTMLALSTLANWQAEDPNNWGVFIDAEYTYDKTWAESLGVDTERVILIKNNEAKAVFEALVGRIGKEGKKTIPGILDRIIEGTLPFKIGVIILDSIDTLTTPLETNSEVGAQNFAPVARFLTTELKRLTPLVAKANVAFIAINQIRMDLTAGKFGNPETTSGGRALKHALSMSILVRPSTAKENKIFDSKETQIGHKVLVKNAKNKLAPAHRSAEYFIEYTKGMVRQAEELLDLGVLIGTISKPNQQSYIINGETFRGREAAAAQLRNPDLYRKIEAETKERYLSDPTAGGAEPPLDEDGGDDEDSEE